MQSTTKDKIMTEKRVRLNQNVHEKLLYLKKKSKAKSINDVILSLILIGEEQYLNDKIMTKDKKICLKYDDGKLVEIKIEN